MDGMLAARGNGSDNTHDPGRLTRRRLLQFAVTASATLGAGLLSSCANAVSGTTTIVSSTAATSTSAPSSVAARAASTTVGSASTSTGVASVSSAANSTTASATQAASAGPARYGHGSTSLLFLTGWVGLDGTTMQKMLANYVQDHTNVTIDFQAQDWNATFAKLDALLVADTPPDLIAVHRTEAPEYGSRGALQPVDDWFAKKLVPKDDFSEPVLAGVTWAGKTIAIPLDMLSYDLYVNTEPLRRAGLDTTKTAVGQEFIDQAQKLSHDQHDAAKAAFAIDGFARNGMLALMWQFGADFLSPDGKEVTLDAQPAQDALQLWNDLIYKYQVYPNPDLKLNTNQLIKDGRIAYRADGDWSYNFYADNGLQPPAFTALPFPQLGPKPVVWMNSHVLAIPVGIGGARYDAAQTLITWISDHGFDWAHAGHPPARLSQQQSPVLQEDWAWSVRAFAKASQQHGRYEVATPRQTELRPYEDKVTAEVQQNKRPIKAIVDDYTAQIKGMLAH